MKITPKSSETLQAQAAAFLKDGKSPETSELYKSRLLGSAVGFSESFNDPDVPPAYVSFLRDAGGRASELIKGRSELLEAYPTFQPEVEALLSDITGRDFTRNAQDDRYLGHGSNSSAYKIVHEGKSYVVRVPHNDGQNSFRIDEYLESAAAGNRIPHLEHIVAASYETGVTVAELLPGKTFYELTAEDLLNMPTHHLDQAITTLQAITDARIELDSKASNFLYDPKEGIGFLDYTQSSNPPSPHDGQSFDGRVRILADALKDAQTFKESNVLETIDDYQKKIPLMEARLAAIRRLYETLADRTDINKVDRDAGLSRIASLIEQQERDIHNYRDTAWVNQEIEQKNTRRQIAASLSDREFNSFTN